MRRAGAREGATAYAFKSGAVAGLGMVPLHLACTRPEPHTLKNPRAVPGGASCGRCRRSASASARRWCRQTVDVVTMR